MEAELYKSNCPGFDMVGVDYREYLPWLVQEQIESSYRQLRKAYETLYIIANSIGAYFAMHTLKNHLIERALFISPILNMERLILDMMKWAAITEDELEEKGEITTESGETLSWKYLSYVRQNPIKWSFPTKILYAEKDRLTARMTVDDFVANHDAHLTIMEKGEHWFHTDEQITFLNEWIRAAIQ